MFFSTFFIGTEIVSRNSCSETRVCFITNEQKRHFYILNNARKNTNWYWCMCVTLYIAA